ncbi:Pr6Pr family membrane protein [Leucobacter rhizosphaerae]|uniref:Pr6Pr family membrane protein n=1 Tax=Leucobacter rhizosphaerae TaxID=2932245 RepID=A0ABY4FTG5_9MICO|nr:Pr6Pr family membrane protein [Leucobacter rhizosphaerae]UOQ59591.1 Pr6Pr family membrane protein [Leucobacter rhizosphaerae]
MPSRPATPRGLALARLAWGLATLAAIVATFVDAAARGPVNPFNFFGYFTIQSNVLLVLVALAAGIVGLVRPGVQPRWLVAARGLATVCMIVVGLVYVTLLLPVHAAGGVEVPWANAVLHIFGPLLVILDWALTTDRTALPRSAILWQLAYPLAWTAVVLVRGATDGWVPYPFLNPSQGYGTVALYVAAIAVVFLVISWLVVWWSRKRP